jgi:hypothetical protein
MAKPNYQYEKRQRELEKKKKKEGKALKKAAGDTSSSHDGPAEHTAPEEAPAAPAGDAPAA